MISSLESSRSKDQKNQRIRKVAKYKKKRPIFDKTYVLADGKISFTYPGQEAALSQTNSGKVTLSCVLEENESGSSSSFKSKLSPVRIIVSPITCIPCPPVTAGSNDAGSTSSSEKCKILGLIKFQSIDYYYLFFTGGTFTLAWNKVVKLNKVKHFTASGRRPSDQVHEECASVASSLVSVANNVDL